jgi:hypothetical protein
MSNSITLTRKGFTETYRELVRDISCILFKLITRYLQTKGTVPT